MRVRIGLYLLFFTTFFSISALAGETEQKVVKHYMGLAQNTLAIIIIDIGYKKYSSDCGSKQAEYQIILDNWKSRNEEVSHNINRAKDIAYKELVESLGKSEAEQIALEIKEELSKAEKQLTESSIRDSQTGNYDCSEELKKLENGYLDIETMFPGINKSLKNYIDRN